MGLKSYLTAREKEDLIEFIAETGENYEKYVEYATSRGWKIYTPKYLHTWIQRKRIKIKVARVEHKEHIRRLSMFDRTKRIESLEQDLNLINSHLLGGAHTCPVCEKTHVGVNPELMIRLTNMKLKLSESIAKERNEWLQPDKSPEGNGQSAKQKMQEVVQRMLLEATEVKVLN